MFSSDYEAGSMLCLTFSAIAQQEMICCRIYYSEMHHRWYTKSCV